MNRLHAECRQARSSPYVTRTLHGADQSRLLLGSRHVKNLRSLIGVATAAGGDRVFATSPVTEATHGFLSFVRQSAATRQRPRRQVAVAFEPGMASAAGRLRARRARCISSSTRRPMSTSRANRFADLMAGKFPGKCGGARDDLRLVEAISTIFFPEVRLKRYLGNAPAADSGPTAERCSRWPGVLGSAFSMTRGGGGRGGGGGNVSLDASWDLVRLERRGPA